MSQLDMFPEDAQVSQIAKLCRLQQSLELSVEELELRLAEKKAELKKVAEEELPNAMLENGCSEFALADGTKVAVNPYYSASITGEKSQDALKWLADHGHGSLVKHEIICAFGKDEHEEAFKAKDALVRAGFTPEDKQGVHPSTLKAFVKEQVENGSELPLDLFNVHIGQKATIKTPRAKK